jgi:acyl-homoserine-lactone acylase
VPVRSQGDFQDWQNVIPGNTATTLWTKTHRYQDLPLVLDPESGWLQNANDPPWTTTFPAALNPDNYPAYIAPRLMYFRAQNSAKMLETTDNISFEEMINYKHSTKMELAERVLDELIPVARQLGNDLAKQAADVLETWDRQAQADSRGAVLFAFWAEEMDFDSMFMQPWQEKLPLSTPNGLADPALAVTTLENVAAQVQKTYGRLDVPWGEVFRLRYGEIDLPANGGDGYLGIFRVLNFMPSENGIFQAVAGDSFVAAIEFSQPVKAMALNSYGNATSPHSTHVGDQLELFNEQKLRPVWRTKAEIKAHLEKSELFSSM